MWGVATKLTTGGGNTMQEKLLFKIGEGYMTLTGQREAFGKTLNDLDNGMPKSRGRCFDIGQWGGCGAACLAFIDGECGEPQEMNEEEIFREHDFELAMEIMSKYECFNHLTKKKRKTQRQARRKNRRGNK
jgi:hypothetical protein